jgi:hypothetical protein
MYAVWIGVVAMPYPLYLWFSRLKQHRSDERATIDGKL